MKPRSKPPKPARPLTEAELTVLLRARFGAPEYAFMFQVRNGTGFSRGTTRTADALAMSLWPSRGLELYGFELKSSRSDWVREKDDPEKAEEIGKFCHRWWVVAGAPNVVASDDLFPPAWGLMVADGGKLRVVREAPLRQVQPLDVPQLAAILRRAAECVVPRAEIAAELKRARDEAMATVEDRVASETKYLKRQLEQLQASVATFEKGSGVEIDTWHVQRVGEAVKFVLAGGLEREEARLRGLRTTAAEVLAALDERLACLPAAARTPEAA